jgi:hypothetical protein
MKRDFILFCLICLVFAACVRPPDYPIEPRLSLPTKGNALSKNTMVQGYKGDSLFVTLDFTDGDGDIGLLKGDTSLFIIDTRDNSFINDAGGIPSVPIQGAGNGISGEMRIRLLSTCCKTIVPCRPQPGKPRDTVIYEIYIKDRAGHESNRLKIPPITLLCQ